MQATVVYVRNPFYPSLDRDVVVLKRRRRLDKLAPKTRMPFVCNHNGRWLLRREWRRTTVADGDVVSFITQPQGGGGGGGGGKNPMATVATIALMVFAPQLGAAIAGAGASSFALAAARVGVMLVGSALINAVFPSDARAAPSTQQAQALAAPSPTYNLQAQGNQARLGQPIAAWYGRNQIYPDWGAEPYSEFVSNELFLYQLFVVGQGSFDIEETRIEDTEVSSFEEITTEVVEPGGTVTLFPTDVQTSVEVTGQEMTYNTYVGGFIVNASGTQANYLGVDVVCPRGLYYANTSGGLDSKTITFDVEARTVDNAGAPTSSYAVIGSETITGATTTPQRLSYRYAVTAGRYQVRVKRTNVKDTDTRAGHEIDWAGLRAYLPGTQQYGNVTVIAMRMKASNQLSGQSSRRVNVIATRKLASWSSGGGWSAEATTSSIAWAAADICRAVYGGDLPDARVDLASLAALNTTWTARGDTFNGGFDQRVTWAEALSKVLRAGRAKWYMQGGIIRFARDGAATVPVMMFTPRNIVAGSFESEFVLPGEDRADSVVAEYLDEDTWRPGEPISCVLPDGPDEKPAKLQMFGITNRDQVFREGIYEAAANRYRTQICRWRTEMEGFVLSPLDYIVVSRDRPNWGQWGDVVSYTGSDGSGGLLNGAVLELSAPVTFDVGTHYIALRDRAGAPVGPFRVVAGDDDVHVVLDEAAPGFTPDIGGNRERTHFAFGLATTIYKGLRVIDMRPRSQTTAEIVAVIEDDRVHSADGSTVPVAGAAMALATVPTSPTVTNVKLIASGSSAAKVYNMGWDPAPGAVRYYIEQSPDGVIWSRAGDTEATSYSWLPQWPGARARVAALGKARGAWVEKVAPDATVSNGVLSTEMDVEALSDITPDAGVITTGKVQNAGGTNFMDLNATGTDDFINANDKVIIDANGDAYFEGYVSSRNLVAASGITTALNGPHSITLADGWILLASVTIDTGLAVSAWDATDEAYVSAAGPHAGVTVSYGSPPGSMVANLSAKTKLWPKWRWAGGATLFLDIELWGEVDGGVSSVTLTGGVDWKVYEVT